MDIPGGLQGLRPVQPQFVALQLIGSILEDKAFEGVFGTFSPLNKSAKVTRHSSARVPRSAFAKMRRRSGYGLTRASGSCSVLTLLLTSLGHDSGSASDSAPASEKLFPCLTRRGRWRGRRESRLPGDLPPTSLSDSCSDRCGVTIHTHQVVSQTTTTTLRGQATVSWWRGLVPVRFAPDGEARSRRGVTVAGGSPLYRAILVKIITSSRAGVMDIAYICPTKAVKVH